MMFRVFAFLFAINAASLRARTVAVTDVATEVTTAPAFGSVITMLNNLVSQLDQEAEADETDYTSFMHWFTNQHSSTSSSIGSLSNRLMELTSVLAGLRARQHDRGVEVARLRAEIDSETGQLTAAKDKRTQEHDAFVTEQLDFDNSIAACNKAVELLTLHYGDGKPKESTKPAWMSLASVLQQVRHAAAKHKLPEPKSLHSLLQTSYKLPPGSTLSDNYEGATDEGLGIVTG